MNYVFPGHPPIANRHKVPSFPTLHENSCADANKVEESIIDSTASVDTNTKETTKKGFSANINPICADLFNDVFPLWTSAKKRKSKPLKLKNEEFDVDTTKRQDLLDGAWH